MSVPQILNGPNPKIFDIPVVKAFENLIIDPHNYETLSQLMYDSVMDDVASVINWAKKNGVSNLNRLYFVFKHGGIPFLLRLDNSNFETAFKVFGKIPIVSDKTPLVFTQFKKKENKKDLRLSFKVDI